jgi:O-antigen/teichoic acid export membrane protein
MASSAVAIRSAVAPLSVLAGRFVAVFAGPREAALGVARVAVLLGFFDIFAVPDGAALTGLGRSRKRPK